MLIVVYPFLWCAFYFTIDLITSSYSYVFLSVLKAEGDILMSKVNENRNQKIQDASRNNNWKEVSRLLDQPLENSLRKDRQYKTVSMNNHISQNGSSKEYGDNIADTNPNPLEHLIALESNKQLGEALSKLSEQERQIILGYYVCDKSYSQLAKEFGISDKTVKKRLESTLQKMKNMLLAE